MVGPGLGDCAGAGEMVPAKKRINKKKKKRKKEMDKWSIHTVEYYSAIKRSEALTHAAMWMNPEYVTLRERRQTEEATPV